MYLKIFFLSIGLLAISAGTVPYKYGKTLNESPLLLAVTGFGSESENLPMGRLIALYRQGNVYVSVKAQETASAYFQSQSGKPIGIREFLRVAKGKIMIITEGELINQLKVLSIDSIGYPETQKPYPLHTWAIQKDSITQLTITGVSALSRSIGILMDEKGPEVIIEKLKPHFKNSDFVHISNEVSLMDTCVFSHKGRMFCSKEAHFKALLGLHCNIVELTGNHNKDYGEQSFLKTLDWYKEHQIKTFGGGRNQAEANVPLILVLKDGTRLGFIGFNELCPLNECAKPNVAGANAWSKEKAKVIIGKMKKELKVDVVIASVQFGEWDFYHPRPTQRKIAYDLIDFGADMVYGPHAHQIQQVEFYKSRPIFFGLGNFLFDETQRIGVRQGMFVNLFIRKGKIIQAKPIFTFMGDDRINALANEAQAEGIRKLIYVDSLLYK